ncbi:beta/gamma crystallin family protein [Flavihumibacter sp. RY-1]|uniref:Beta/gamma crystallin family protein n=1 Tax=Flavihumibacter fluminis TaxID=2909236 RepID=A0ABS9BH28_9BACT|nr:beta/gamma crystallin family protein [Flavihumibacter fluminis]MCF1714996.1 beta/gamma crystallin family protein [Flavihumibacter fluminis]
MIKRLLQISLLLLAPLFLFSQVIIYSDCNYRGRYEQLGPGNYLNPFQFRLGDNTISSIKISRGFRVELYDNINLIGTPIVLNANYACLSAAINNRISSIRVTYSNQNPWEQTNPAGGVALFTACQFSGINAFLPPGDYSRLSGIIGDNAVSSFRIPEGMVLELFTEANFRGNSSGPITNDNTCLPSYWNNRASSARVYYRENGSWLPPPPPANSEEVVQLYVGCNYWGRPVTVRAGEYNSLDALLNRQPLGAIQVPPGMTIELYSGQGLSGNLLARYTSNQSCLPTLIQFRAQSVRVISNESGGNWNGKGATLFNDCDFRGRSRVFPVGRYSNINQSFGINPASIRVGAGYVVQLFQQPNFQGISSGKLTENNRCLGTSFRGRVRSVIITYEPNLGGGGNFEDVILYGDCYYQGRSLAVRPGYFPSLSNYGGISVNPASLRVPQGYEVELFTGENYSGSRFVINSNNTCLPSTHRNRIRSMAVKYNGYGGGGSGSGWSQEVSLFSSCYFGGSSTSLREGRYKDLRSAGVSNNFGIASLRVPQGFEVELYPYAGFQGARAIIRGDNTCLGTALRGRVKSLIVRRIQGFQPAGVRTATDSTQQ